MYFKLFSQASIEVTVSFEESNHCFSALCEVITSTVHEFRFGCSEKRLKSELSQNSEQKRSRLLTEDKMQIQKQTKRAKAVIKVAR